MNSNTDSGERCIECDMIITVLGVAAIQVSGTEYVEAMSPIQLTCNATGRPEPPHDVDWYKNDSKVGVDAHGGIIITKKIETRVLVSMLVIEHSRVSDSGTYFCRSSNGETGSIVVHVLQCKYRQLFNVYCLIK